MTSGLEDVVAAETRLSEVDGARGELIIRGQPLDRLAGHLRFEDIVLRLFDGLFDDLPGRDDLAAALGDARREVFELVESRDTAGRGDDVRTLSPIEALRARIARLPDGEDVRTALRLLAAPAVCTPAIVRRRRGLAPIPPDPSMPHAADILRMLHGSLAPTAAPASAARAAALDTYLVTVCDHGLNASTFAARIVASTRAGLTSAVLAGLSALKGPLHGGAPGPVIAMLDEIGEPARATAWLEGALARGERLMGFGHRIYRVRDPRADALKAAVTRLAAAEAEAGETRAVDGTGSDSSPASRLALAEAVEAAALDVLRRKKPNRPLDTNVEFYTALLLEALAFPADAFTCVFAIGRTAGWLAHAREQIATGRLIRPQSHYIGPRPPERVHAER